MRSYEYPTTEEEQKEQTAYYKCLLDALISRSNRIEYPGSEEWEYNYKLIEKVRELYKEVSTMSVYEFRGMIEL